MYLQKIKTKIEQKLRNKYNVTFIIKTNFKNDLFDLYVPLYPYQQYFKTNVKQIFTHLRQEIEVIPEIDRIFLQNSFCKIKINYSKINLFILNDVLQKKDQYCRKEKNDKTIIIDYSSPNIAKNFSIGHLRSTVIGNTLKKIYQKLGFNVISINHLGDWGTQFGKMILAYQKWGKKEIILKNPINELQKLYVRFHQEVEKNPQLNDEAKEIFLKLEQKQVDVTKLWKWFKKISLQEFHKIYSLLNVNFDYYTGESFFQNFISEIIKELKEKKLILLDKKAYIMPLDELPTALIQKDNGSSLYLTRDIACVIYRYKKFRFYKCLYVAGNEQKLHFKQLKKIIEKMGYNLQLFHVNFGLILVNNMKISTRKNNNYKLIDIIEQTEQEARKIIHQKNPNLNLEKIHQIAQKIAIGAIIFNDLKYDRQLDIEFNLKKMLQFEGDTGPYLQYTIVRLNSVIKKSQLPNLQIIKDWGYLDLYYKKPHYLILIRLIDNFNIILEKTKEKNMPSILARYLLELAKKSNQFYTKEKILVDDQILKKANLLLINAVNIILKEGLKILGVPILENM
ncbi:MAG: arginine--tRNA ligase [Vigna little leaf phytoplasma]|nr:arginine--tRNA ligase [Vigna little leaf phytoplasma]